jgi:hypothetical protein
MFALFQSIETLDGSRVGRAGDYAINRVGG